METKNPSTPVEMMILMGIFNLFKRFTRPRAKLWLRIGKNELFLGEELKGMVEVKSEEEFDIEGVTLSLKCVESVKKTRTRIRKTPKLGSIDKPINEEDEEEEVEVYEEEYWDKALLFSRSLKVSNEMHVPIGFSKEFPFTIQLPLIGRETYHGVDRNLKWYVKAVMKVRGRRSKQTSCEILVTKPPVITKEVIREVVLIPCPYCGGLMPQTSTFCPNCGARRTA